MPTLAGIEGKQNEVGRNERPFLIADIGGVRFAVHPAMTLPARHGSEHLLVTIYLWTTNVDPFQAIESMLFQA